VDWQTRSFHFESINKITPKYEIFPTNTLDSKHFKLLFVGARTFIQATKKGDAIFVYAILTLDPGTQQHEIPIQYQNYKDVFEKKNANTLLEH
jgi:hypothetical protein